MKNCRFALLPLVPLLLAVTPASAQDTSTPDAGLASDFAPAPVYDIEVIVFEYRQGQRGRAEDFAYEDTGRAKAQAERESRLSVPLPGEDILTETAPESDTMTDDEPPEDEGPEPRPLVFTPVPSSQFKLTEARSRLENVGGFRTLMHAAWQQPVYGADEQTTLDLARVANLPQRLGGTASIFVNRFLHLTLDLELADNRRSAGTDTLLLHINERRKMRSTEVHFFDHPSFGALALITPVATSDAD